MKRVLTNSGMILITTPNQKDFDQTGIPILVCGTCLNHFNLLEQKQVGEITNMLDIVTAMQVADKVITI